MSFRLFLLCLFITAPALAATGAGRDHMATFENEIKIHYTVSGEGEPTLVFIHGWACDASVWDKQVEELGRSMRCIAIDLPGHGLSDKPNIDYSMSMYAHAIDAVLHDAGVPSAIIVGHSNGVPVVRQFYRE